jgi:hypothetical protein
MTPLFKGGNMNLKEIFRKPIDRPIEGVIKADDESSLYLEIEEYVLTNEISKRLENFLDAYNNYQGANGVWISGFFGSGKSHLLKILSLVLENRLVNDIPALDLFLPKCTGNEILRGDLKRAAAIPSQSILFNIDQKADVISKTQIDALVSVFVKVFDEHCGYYGKQGHIAQFERDLDSRSLYPQFKEKYQEIAGLSWENGREQALLEGDNIATAYAAISGTEKENTTNILDKYRSEYKLSIEDFANQVNNYIKTQEPGFRLNFFVDEVGQYIADNTKLMTNLQTIAESLATKCRGQAWVIVTAQEDMDSVVGEMNKQKGNDFTKIQARFANRMKLTSANVAEVIQRRLLEKNEIGISILSDIYHRESNNLRTLFDFIDGAQTYRNFRDRDHFIHSYPFIPYQFDLFQKAIQNLSLHNAFTGQHSSVGERSMLGVFQEVAIQIIENNIGHLATFDLMFAGLRTALKGQIQTPIRLAEDNLDNPFAVKLLKALFLVKYIKDFKTTTKNLRILMLDGFSNDIKALTQQVEEALDLLEQQTYIQRNGEEYEFLTNEEKDIEHEIKATEIDLSEAAEELAKIAFDQILKIQKIHYAGNDHNYPFGRKMDNQLHGREQELNIHLISPFNDNDEKTVKTQSMGRDELLVMMPPDKRLIADLLLQKRTNKYIRQNSTTTQKDSIRHILSEKALRNQERLQNLQQQTKTILSRARLFIAGQEIEELSEDPQTRITNACQKLITRTYPNLAMLPGINFTEKHILDILRAKQPALTGLSEAEQEMLSFIQSNQRTGIRTTVKVLVDKFEAKPHGWYLMAIICTLAKLCSFGKIEVRADGTLLDDSKLDQALKNTRSHANLILEPQAEFSASQVRALKDFFNEFFDRPPQNHDAKTLAAETGQALQQLKEKLTGHYNQNRDYPFLASLKEPIAAITEITGKPYAFYLTELSRKEEALLDLKENIINPLTHFMAGPHKAIYDEIREFLRHQESNFTYLGNGAEENLQTIINNPACYKNNVMQEAKGLLLQTQQEIQALIEKEKSRALQTVTELENRLSSMEKFAVIPSGLQIEVKEKFKRCQNSLEQQTLIAVINDSIHRFENNDYQQMLARVHAWQPPAPKPAPKPETFDDIPTERKIPVVKEPIPPTLVPLNTIKPSFNNALLANEEEVDLYLSSLKKAIMQEINNHKEISL